MNVAPPVLPTPRGKGKQNIGVAMSIAHGAQHASPTILLPLEDATTHADGEPIGEGFEYIGERLAVLAVAARIMVRRNPNDVYARSIARETLRLAGAMREALHHEDAIHSTRDTAPASGIVETTLATATATPSDTTHPPHTPASPSSPSSPSSAPPATPDATPSTRHRARGSARASALTSSSSKRKGGAV